MKTETAAIRSIILRALHPNGAASHNPRRSAVRIRGFTLLELMIVVAVIAIVAAMAIPSLMNARKTANEGRAIATLRTIVTVQEQYRTRFGSYASQLDDLEIAGYIEIVFDAYDVVAYSSNQNTWALSAGPTTPADGDRYFYADVTGVIRFESTGPATNKSPPID